MTSMLGILCLWSEPAAAYIGPGAGLSAIGTAIALVATVCLAIVGFLWYPMKRLSKRLVGKTKRAATETGDDQVDNSTRARPPS